MTASTTSRIHPLAHELAAPHHVLHAVDHLQPRGVRGVQLLALGVVRHDAVEHAVREVRDRLVGEDGRVHPQRQEGLAVHERALVLVERNAARDRPARERAFGASQLLAVGAVAQRERHRLRTFRHPLDGNRDRCGPGRHLVGRHGHRLAIIRLVDELRDERVQRMLDLVDVQVSVERDRSVRCGVAVGGRHQPVDRACILGLEEVIVELDLADGATGQETEQRTAHRFIRQGRGPTLVADPAIRIGLVAGHRIRVRG